MPCLPSSTTYCNPTGFTDIPTFLLAIVANAILIASPFIVMFIIYAGFLFVTAQGNQAQVSKAKSTLFYTLIGAAVLIGARIIADAIKTSILTL